MKKVLFTTLLLLTLTLAACGGAASTSQAASSTQESTSLSTATQLVVGTFKLEDTDQAVTSEQAKGLLVMWDVYQNLISSDTAAQAEIDALVNQIQETMTTNQMNAIQAMNLTQQNVFATMQEQGGDFMQVRQSSSGDTFSFSPNAGGGPPDGGGGGMPADGGDMGGGAPPDSGIGDGMGGTGSSTSTDQTQNAGTDMGAGGSTGVPTVLVEALIQYLQQIVNA